MDSFDPRGWHIGAAMAVGAGLGACALEAPEDEAGLESNAEDPRPIGDECETSVDCPGTDRCYYGYCQPYYNPKPGYDCLVQHDCGVGQFCQGNNCYTAQYAPDCSEAQWSPLALDIPLDVRADAGPLSLHVADFEGDGRDELLVRQGSELRLLDPAALTLSPALTPTLPKDLAELAVLDLDGDGTKDLLVAGADPSQPALVGLGQAPGEFGVLEPGPILDAQAWSAFSWSPGEPVALAALAGSEAVVFADLLGGLTTTSITADLQNPSVDQLRVGDFDGDGGDEAMLLVRCRFHIQGQGAWSAKGNYALMFDDVCLSAAGDYGGDGRDDLVVIHGGNGVSTLRMFEGRAMDADPDTGPVSIDRSFDVDLPGWHRGALVLESGGPDTGTGAVAVWGGESPLLVRSPSGASGDPCVEVHPELQSVSAAIGADLDGDGDHELLVLDIYGHLRGLTRDP